jgi:hypothetical protein
MTQSEIKASVRARDGQRCVDCGLPQSEHPGVLRVHRLNSSAPLSVDGCVTLCRDCCSKRVTGFHIKAAIFERDGRCVDCGALLGDQVKLRVFRLVAGEAYSVEGGVAVCQRCYAKRTRKRVREWWEQRQREWEKAKRAKEEARKAEEAARKARERKPLSDNWFEEQMRLYDELFAKFKQHEEEMNQIARRALLREDVDRAAAKLGLAWPCTARQLNVAFRQEAFRHHPDRGGRRQDFEAVIHARDILAEALAT